MDKESVDGTSFVHDDAQLLHITHQISAPRKVSLCSYHKR